jgi:hypothetical protein
VGVGVQGRGVQVEGEDFDGGREQSLWTSYGMVWGGKRDGQVMLPVQNQFGTQAAREADQERWLLRSRQSIPAALAVNISQSWGPANTEIREQLYFPSLVIIQFTRNIVDLRSSPST